MILFFLVESVSISPGGWEWDFWTINSRTSICFTYMDSMDPTKTESVHVCKYYTYYTKWILMRSWKTFQGSSENITDFKRFSDGGGPLETQQVLVWISERCLMMGFSGCNLFSYFSKCEFLPSGGIFLWATFLSRNQILGFLLHIGMENYPVV